MWSASSSQLGLSSHTSLLDSRGSLTGAPKTLRKTGKTRRLPPQVNQDGDSQLVDDQFGWSYKLQVGSTETYSCPFVGDPMVDYHQVEVGHSG